MTASVEHSHTHQHDGLNKGVEAVEKLADAVKATGALPPAVESSPPKSKSKWSKWINAALVAGGLSGAGLLGGVINYAFSKATPEVTAPADGSLLQYLEDKGQHLPEGFAP
jgi:hypothetical protein